MCQNGPFVSLVSLLSMLVLVAADCEQGIIESGVTSYAAQRIVDKHNELRLLVARGQLPGQPRGVNLRRMRWDQQLANAAQDITDTCIFQTVPVDDDRFSVGQNLYMLSSTSLRYGSNWTAAVQAWFDKHRTYTYPNGYNTYTQVVWANTVYVGCGYTHYLSNDNWYNKIYVCNYGPGGNNIGEVPYRTGPYGCENLC